MLTNQLIGAAQNAVNHSPRPSAPQAQPVQPALPFSAVKSDTNPMTTRPVSATQETKDTRAEMREERPPLEIPKRAEMRILLVDTIPDAVPESIYDAKVADQTEKYEPAEQK
ncbi:MAG: hypothetical protein AAF340_01530 [Pseudomonadota bacterium]